MVFPLISFAQYSAEELINQGFKKRTAIEIEEKFDGNVNSAIDKWSETGSSKLNKKFYKSALKLGIDETYVKDALKKARKKRLELIASGIAAGAEGFAEGYQGANTPQETEYTPLVNPTVIDRSSRESISSDQNSSLQNNIFEEASNSSFSAPSSKDLMNTMGLPTDNSSSNNSRVTDQYGNTILQQNQNDILDGNGNLKGYRNTDGSITTNNGGVITIEGNQIKKDGYVIGTFKKLNTGQIIYYDKFGNEIAYAKLIQN